MVRVGDDAHISKCPIFFERIGTSDRNERVALERTEYHPVVELNRCAIKVLCRDASLESRKRSLIVFSECPYVSRIFGLTELLCGGLRQEKRGDRVRSGEFRRP